MKRIATGLTALTLAATASLASTATTTAQAAPTADRTPTNFAFKGSGYGTKLSGGQVPVDSNTTAFAGVGCSNNADLDKGNDVAEATLPGAGTAEEVTTRLWTTAEKGVVANNSESYVERIELAGSPLGTLVLSAITSTARAFHGDKGFDSTAKTTIGSISLVPPTGEAQELELPTPGEPLPVPGVGTIALGDTKTTSNGDGAKAFANGVLVQLESGTTLRIAHTRATIERGVRSGLLGGAAYAANSSALDENLQLGRNPLSLMPCAGTEGKERVKSLARVTLGEDVELRNLASRQQGTQLARKALGFELGRVGAVELNDGDVVLRDIVGRVDLVRKGRDLKRDVDSSIGAIVVQGEETTFDEGEDVLNIPGVAKLERNLRENTKWGAKVIALRITLLDALGEQKAVLNIGAANLSIKPALRG
jgi:hypothetical protein